METEDWMRRGNHPRKDWICRNVSHEVVIYYHRSMIHYRLEVSDMRCWIWLKRNEPVGINQEVERFERGGMSNRRKGRFSV